MRPLQNLRPFFTVLISSLLFGSLLTLSPSQLTAAPIDFFESRQARNLTSYDGPVLGKIEDAEAVMLNSSSLQQSQFPLLNWGKVAYQGFQTNNWNIFYMDDDGSTQHRLAATSAAEIHPDLNRGATQMVFTSNRSGSYELYRINTDGNGLTRLTVNTTDDVHPAWSPDGKQIVFQAYRHGQPEIYLMNADGSSQRRLTNHDDYDGVPTWTPDGHILFSSRRNGLTSIYKMDSNGDNLKKLTNIPLSYNAAVSPDGNRVAFDADPDRDGWQELLVMDMDGTNVKIIENLGPFFDSLAGGWSPNGRYLSKTKVAYRVYNGQLYIFHVSFNGWDSLATTTHGNVRLGDISLTIAANWQTTDTSPPTLTFNPLAPLTPQRNFGLTWTAQDIGEAGVAGYDIQYRQQGSETWATLLQSTEETSSTFAGAAGERYEFRVRVRDNAFNYSEWQQETTTFFMSQFKGQLMDNRGTPLSQIALSIEPNPLTAVESDSIGQFKAHSIDDGSHSIHITHPDYRTLADTVDLSTDKTADLYLQPKDNVIRNGTFDLPPDLLSDWITTGSLPIYANSDFEGAGGQAIRLGAECPYPCFSELEPIPFAYDELQSMVIDSQGNLHGVTVGLPNGEAHQIFHLQRQPNGVWHEPTLVAQTNRVFSAQLTVDQDDTLSMIWVDTDEDRDNPTLYHTSKAPNNNWESPTIVLRNISGDPSHPMRIVSAQMDSNNQLHVLINSKGLFYLKRDTHGHWSTITKVNDDTYSAEAMFIEPNGKVHLTWIQTERDGSNREDRFKYWATDINGSWEHKQTLYAEVDHLRTDPIGIAATADGTVHIFIRHDDFNYAQRSPSGEWQPLEKLHDLRLNHIRLVVDHAGTLHSLFIGTLPGNTNPSNQNYASWSPRSDWNSLYTFDSEPFSNFGMPQITADKLGHLTILWHWGASDNLYLISSLPAALMGTATLQQSVTIPEMSQAATLSFRQRHLRWHPEASSTLELQVSDADGTTRLPLPSASVKWTHSWIGMEPWTGKTVDIAFVLNQAVGDPSIELWLDDISLGSAHPDLWIEIEGASKALPGEQQQYQIHYGNRGGVATAAGMLVMTLPDGIVYNEASIMPDSENGQTLRWDLGALTAVSTPSPLTITTTVSSDTPMLSELTIAATISSQTAELAQYNNVAAAPLFIGHRIYYPIMATE